MTSLRPKPIPTDVRDECPLLPRTDPITHLPILILYPHSRCNCRCLMCEIWRVKDRTELQATDVARWLDEWRELGVRRVVLSGGEALLHSHLWELCAHLRRADIGITLLSSGLLLRRDAPLLTRYCDDVVVSLDGPCHLHNAIRSVPRAYERLADGIAAVRALDSQISVSGRCTVQRANFRALRVTVRSAHELGLSRISFLAVDTHSAAFNRAADREATNATSTALTENDLPELTAELDALEREHAEDFERGFIAESQEKLRLRLEQYFRAGAGQGDFAPITCNAPWVSSVIEADGTVRPCFFQPPLGNIHAAGSLQAVLNAPEAIRFRQNLDTHTDPICRRCVCSLALKKMRDEG
jgi:MoaA/NifB/PqqE/SkfB family radical SAM enzyme